MVVGFTSMQGVAGICYWVVFSILLYLDVSISSRKGLFRSAKAKTGAIAHFFFNV